MRSTKAQAWLLAVALGYALTAASCHAPTKEKPTGSAQLSVLAEALMIDTVTIEVSQTGINGGNPFITQNLANTMDEGYTGVIGSIPVGMNHFVATAYYMGNPVYSGPADATITEGNTTPVMIILQNLTMPSPFVDTAPIISSVTASSESIAPGDMVTLTVMATDPDVGDMITYSWTDSDMIPADFSAPGADTTTWTAPMSTGPHTITIKATDNYGAYNAVSLIIDVETANGQGSASVQVTFNDWPSVANASVSPALVAGGGNATVSVTAADADSDMLTYQWADSCISGGSGSFASPMSPSSMWTAPGMPPMGGICYLTVTISDGKGGSNTATVGAQVGPAISPILAPVLGNSFQGGSSIELGEMVTLTTAATDPQGLPLTFNWNKSSEITLGSQDDEPMGMPTSSTLTATLTTADAMTYTITCDVSNGTLTTTQTFVLALGTTPVAIANASFESPSLGGKGASSDPTMWGSGGDTQAVAYYPQDYDVDGGNPGGVPDGVQVLDVAYVPGDDFPHAAEQDLGPAMSNAEYSLSFALASSLSFSYNPVTVTLNDGAGTPIINQTISVPPLPSNFGTVTLTSTAPFSGLTGNLALQFTGGFGAAMEEHTYVDNVSLTVRNHVEGLRFSEIDSKGDTTCGVATNGTLWCWGNNGQGQTGTGSITAMVDYPLQVGTEADWATVNAGSQTTCALKTDGTLWCWGEPVFTTNVAFSTGNGEVGWTSNNANDPPVVQVGGTVQFTVTGGGMGPYTWSMLHNVTGGSIDPMSGLYTAGPMMGIDYVQVVDTDIAVTAIPITVGSASPNQIGTDTDWSQLTVGDNDSGCAIKQSGALYCWGSNQAGEVGVGNTFVVNLPTQVGSANDWQQVSNNGQTTCGVEAGGIGSCWGAGSNGNTAQSNTADQVAPVQVLQCAGGTTTMGVCSGSLAFAAWKSIVSGDNHACGIQADNSLWCWGGNTNGELGDNDPGVNVLFAELIDSSSWKQLSGGPGQNCSLKSDDTVWCWGYNGDGENGLGYVDTQEVAPMQVGGGASYGATTMSWDHACAIRLDGSLFCWGTDSADQLGDGLAIPNNPTPERIGG